MTLLHSGRLVRTGSRFLSSWMSLTAKAFAPDGIFGMDSTGPFRRDQKKALVWPRRVQSTTSIAVLLAPMAWPSLRIRISLAGRNLSIVLHFLMASTFFASSMRAQIGVGVTVCVLRRHWGSRFQVARPALWRERTQTDDERKYTRRPDSAYSDIPIWNAFIAFYACLCRREEFKVDSGLLSNV
jgi:hypothetical protein